MKTIRKKKPLVRIGKVSGKVRLSGATMETRLEGAGLTTLRLQRFDVDGWKCKTCGRKVDDDLEDWNPRKAQLRHLQGRGVGGSDTIENTETSCGECHFRWEHHPRVIARKRK